MRSHPVDGAVLMGGCDKTTPALLHGRDQRRPAGDLRAGRADAARQLARARCSAPARTPGSTGTSAAPATSPRPTGTAIEGGIARSHGTCMTMGTASTMTAIAEAIGMTPARRLVDPGRRRQPRRAWRRVRPAHRRDGLGGPAAGAHPDARRLRERDRRRDGDGLLDQRDHPPDRDGAARRLPTSASTTSTRGEPRRAGDRQHPAERRQVPDGGLLLCRRPAGADEAHRARTSHLDALHRHRPHARREHRRRRGLRRRRHPAARPIRSTPKARSPCCAATSRPTAA